MKNLAKKYIFLDVDGTLVNFKGKMSDSCKEALRQAQKNNHEIFLCTGRNRSFIYDFLYDFGFDGIVAGTGTYIEYKSKVIFSEYFTAKQLKQICNLLNNKKTNFILSTDRGSVSTKDKLLGIFKSVLGHNKNINFDNLDEDLFNYNDFVKSIEPYIIDEDIKNYPRNYKDCTGICYSNCDYDIQQVSNMLDKSLKVNEASFSINNLGCGEITLSSFTKTTAINYIINYLGVNIKDTIAVGDSFNDCDMIKNCNIGIAMGNSVNSLKEIADYITSDIDEDGIKNAFKHFNII